MTRRARCATRPFFPALTRWATDLSTPWGGLRKKQRPGVGASSDSARRANRFVARFVRGGAEDANAAPSRGAAETASRPPRTGTSAKARRL
jgi:hypothetical protein